MGWPSRSPWGSSVVTQWGAGSLAGWGVGFTGIITVGSQTLGTLRSNCLPGLCEPALQGVQRSRWLKNCITLLLSFSVTHMCGEVWWHFGGKEHLGAEVSIHSQVPWGHRHRSLGWGGVVRAVGGDGWTEGSWEEGSSSPRTEQLAGWGGVVPLTEWVEYKEFQNKWKDPVSLNQKWGSKTVLVIFSWERALIKQSER